MRVFILSVCWLIVHTDPADVSRVDETPYWGDVAVSSQRLLTLCWLFWDWYPSPFPTYRWIKVVSLTGVYLCSARPSHSLGAVRSDSAQSIGETRFDRRRSVLNFSGLRAAYRWRDGGWLLHTRHSPLGQGVRSDSAQSIGETVCTKEVIAELAVWAAPNRK